MISLNTKAEALLKRAMKHPGVKEVMEVYEASQLVFYPFLLLDLNMLEQITITTASDNSTESL